jgi:hypothetical protein
MDWSGELASEVLMSLSARPGTSSRTPPTTSRLTSVTLCGLARLLSAGELRLVRVPEPDEEQLRDLVRSREDLRVDLTRIRNRIGKFLLHREIYAPQHTETWGVLHRKWLRGLVFDDSPQSSSLKMRCMLTTSW